MFKVLCINLPKRCVRGSGGTMPSLQVGDFYTVVGEVEFMGRVYYVLAEFGPDHAFLSSCFAVLSGIDETSLVNELQTSLTV